MADPCTIDGDPAYSKKLVEIYAAGMRRMANRLASGDLSVSDWRQQMREAIDKMFAFQAMAGVNGDKSQIDNRRLRLAIQGQYKYLDRFAADIESALSRGASVGFVASRAALYAGSSRQSYWEQAVNVKLPAYPGDGSTPCLGHCACTWEIGCEGNYVLATWVLGATDHCPVCVQRAQQWNPLRIRMN